MQAGSAREGGAAAHPKTVFLSSRFRESDALAELRALLTLELSKRFTTRPVNLDDGRADIRSPEHRSVGQAQAADLVVLVLGPTSGPAGADGRSMTEREFDAAVAAHVPVLAYRMSPDATAETEEASAFRRRVEARLTIGELHGSAARDAAEIVADVYEALAGQPEPIVPDRAGSSVVIGGDAKVVGSTIVGGNLIMGRGGDDG